MTVKQIAALCGKTEMTVRRWAHKADPAQNVQGISQKLVDAEKSGTAAADFTQEETISIIRAGGNDTLASLLEDNARDKNALAIQQTNPSLPKMNAELIKLIDARIEIKFKNVIPLINDKAASIQIEKPKKTFAEKYEESKNIVADFVSKHIDFTNNPDDTEPEIDLYQAYKTFCYNLNKEPVTRNDFSHLLPNRRENFFLHQKKKTRFWRNLRYK